MAGTTFSFKQLIGHLLAVVRYPVSCLNFQDQRWYTVFLVVNLSLQLPAQHLLRKIIFLIILVPLKIFDDSYVLNREREIIFFITLKNKVCHL